MAGHSPSKTGVNALLPGHPRLWRGKIQDVDARHKAGHDGTMSDAISELKSIIRKDALLRRDALPAAERAQAAETIAARPFPLALAAGTIVSGFMPLKTEVNPLPLLRKLSQRGVRLALPAIAGRGHPLIMRAFAFGDELASGQWGIREPKVDAPDVAPDVMLVPLLAFDRHGHRIGYGAGYYDMTIGKFRAMKPVVAVGIAFAAQEIGEVPVTPRDARLDLVLTEREIIDLRGS
jgi:5-formyltetrahydrofolate cyclo-ligase